MLQLKCIKIMEHARCTLVQVHFELLLNGEPTRQYADFLLQPDFCEVGDLFALTAHDFIEWNSILSGMSDSLN
jgi:hypothetical protein